LEETTEAVMVLAVLEWASLHDIVYTILCRVTNTVKHCVFVCKI